jgi:hypothetical protein
MQTPFQKTQHEKSTGKKNMKKSEGLTDTPVKERITAGIKSVSAKKALVLERKKVREVKRLKSKRHVSRNKSCSWSDDSDVDRHVYNNSSNSSMDVEDEPPYQQLPV